MKKRCRLASCRKPFTATVPWQHYCRKPCTDKASQQKRAGLMKAGLKALKRMGLT